MDCRLARSLPGGGGLQNHHWERRGGQENIYENTSLDKHFIGDSLLQSERLPRHRRSPSGVFLTLGEGLPHLKTSRTRLVLLWVLRLLPDV